MRPIDADRLDLYLLSYESLEFIKDCIDNEPTIKEKHAHWITQGRKLKCSNCSKLMYIGTDDISLLEEEKEINKYCFNCGAKMDEEVEK